MKITKKLLKEISQINTYEDLESFAKQYELRANCDISYRGGGVGVYSEGLCNLLGLLSNQLPRSYGAGCNYLGGGVRGAIFTSGYDDNIPSNKAEFLDAFGEAMKRVYRSIEDEEGMNEDSEEEPNWDARCTKASREAGIKSAY